MPDALWWLPSLIVFGTTAIVVVGAVKIVRMRRRRGALASGSASDPLDELERRAGLALVRADDALKTAEDEVEFARAQFGDGAASEFATAVAEARVALRDAFRLRQQLHDEVPDSHSQRTRWNTAILELCATATARIDTQTSSFDERRALERTAPDRLAELRAAVENTQRKIPGAEETIERLRRSYDPRTYAAVADAPRASAGMLGEALSALADAEGRIARRETASADLEAATTLLLDSRQGLDAVERTATLLDEASSELASLIADVRLDVAQARVLRDSSELPAAGEEIGAAISAVTTALSAVTGRGSIAADAHPDPFARIELLREAAARLDGALASARTQTQRIDNARSALRGALFAARSHIEVAAGFIDANRGSVGADARTRLAEAQRQLTLAEVADDPVEALDTARRASRIAQDADALARYDAGPRTAPLAS